MYLKSSGRSLRRVRKDRRKTIFAGLRGARLRPARFLTKPKQSGMEQGNSSTVSTISSPFSCQVFLAWGLSALCALFPPGEAELLPAPSPSSPTRIPLRITPPLFRSFDFPSRYSCTQRTEKPGVRKPERLRPIPFAI